MVRAAYSKTGISMNPIKVLMVGAALCALACAPAAADPVQARNGRFEASVSGSQMSRVVIVGEKIVEVRTVNDPEGPQMIVEAADTGDVFVAFDAEAMGKSFSAFFITSSGRTIQGVLTPGAMDGQTVQVLPEAVAQGRIEQRADRRSPYQETVTGLIRLMFNGEAPEGVVRLRPKTSEVKAGSFAIRVAEVYDVQGLRGQVLEVRNASPTKQAVVGDSFFVAGVLAVAVSSDELQPNATARVFLVEEH